MPNKINPAETEDQRERRLERKRAQNEKSRRKMRDQLPPHLDDGPSDDGSEYTKDEVEFLMALDREKRRRGPFLTDAQVLGVAKSLGYQKS